MPYSKGKRRALGARDEGPGKSEGVVLDLSLAGDGIWSPAYTVPVTVGGQTFQLQVDTGSSDMWIATNGCSTDPCKAAKGHTYDPSNARGTGSAFSINYLVGSVSGPIVWDSVQLGGYRIDNQALAAADQVTNEPLSSAFSGLLGLAHTANSLIAQQLLPTTSDAPDGATFASNLFGLTPSSEAPAARFLSLSLSRPGSDRVRSHLGVGRHPSDIVSDPSKIAYSRLVNENVGAVFWKSNVRGLSVWVNGEERPVELGRSRKGGVFPTAVLDSGVPIILTTSAIANGIYGALGIGPGSDGNYYVPCSTPLNVSITLDAATIPLHPLDLTARAPSDPSGQNCVGLIQSADAALLSADSRAGEFILGVPFLRNAYTVFAYSPPESNGTFSAAAVGAVVTPRLGLLSLTDPTVAMNEFVSVRVHNQPLSSNRTSSSNGSDGGANGSPSGGGKRPGGVPVGVQVFAGIAGFFVLCGIIFLFRWLFTRRQGRRSGTETPDGDSESKAAAYALTRRNSGGYGAATLAYGRGSRYDSYYSTTSTSGEKEAHGEKEERSTLRASMGGKTLSATSSRGTTAAAGGRKSAEPDEFGAKVGEDGGVWDPRTALPEEGLTLVDGQHHHRRTPSATPLLPAGEEQEGPGSPVLGADRLPRRPERVLGDES